MNYICVVLNVNQNYNVFDLRKKIFIINKKEINEDHDSQNFHVQFDKFKIFYFQLSREIII